MKARYRLLGVIAACAIGLVTGIGGNTLHVRAAETSVDQEAQRKLESVMGKMVLAEWTRVKSAEDLKSCTSWTPMRLYYDFHALYNMRDKLSADLKSIYENKGYLILASGNSQSSLTYSKEDIASQIYTDENFIELYPKGQDRNGYILYSGSDDTSNGNIPMCKISLNSTRQGYLDIDSDRGLQTNASWQDNWSVYPRWNGSQHMVSLFINLSGEKDPSLRISVSPGYQAKLYSDTKGDNDDYDQYAMYIGKLTDVTVIQRDITVGEGQTVRISEKGAVALQAGVTLTIEEGGAAIIQSRFLNQGTIINHGTLVIMDGGSLQPIYDPGSGSILCDGGDIVIMNGGRFMSSEALTLTNGSSIVNRGIFLMKKSLTLDNSALITEAEGSTYLGYVIKPADFMNAGKTTVSKLLSTREIRTGPGLNKSYPTRSNYSSLNLKNGARLVNRGETCLNQSLLKDAKSSIREESGTMFYWN